MELFCGTGRLTASIRRLGLSDSVGVDNTVHRYLSCPILKMDLSNDECVTLLENMLRQDRLAYVHMAPPCGTSSRARLIKRPGRFNPPPARSDSFPDGLPNLGGTLKERVLTANRLYNLCGYIFKRCYQLGVMASVENPGRSFMWNTTHWTRHIDFPTYHTMFHHCCYGSQRRKLTRLVHTMPLLNNMCATCPGESKTHKHLGWGLAGNTWATAQETSYPYQLCQTWASIFFEQLIQFDAIPPAASMSERDIHDHKAAQAELGTQAKRKRLPPLVKEFKDVFHVVCNPHQIPPGKIDIPWPIPTTCEHTFPSQNIPAGSRIVRTQILGDVNASTDKDHDNNVGIIANSVKVFVGIPWTPAEFLEQAADVRHPKHVVHSLDSTLKDVISALADKPAVDIGRLRIQAMHKWIQKARDLEQVEADIRDQMPAHCAGILKNKRLSLFRDMLNEIEYEDGDIVADMCVGFKLTGPIKGSSMFRKKRSSATISVDELRRSAKVTREGILRTTVSSGDDELDKALQAATDAELERGWLWGPIKEDELPDQACISRRFGIWQGGKCRPIDNLKESGLNASTSASDTITVHTADYIAAGIAYKLACGKSLGKMEDLAVKSWDLRKAYKNLPVHSDSLDDNYLAVYHPEVEKALVYGQRVLPFGSRSSVHGFVRVAIAIWMLGMRLFLLHWNVYFDDFICTEYSSLLRLTDMCVCNFFSMLGWEISDDKDSVFSACAKFLGIEIDLTSARLGSFTLQNTEKRRDELVTMLSDIIEKRQLLHKEGASLRGRLVFAEAQLAGRQAGLAFHQLTQHVLAGKVHIDDDVLESLRFLKERLIEGKPRMVTWDLGETIHIYVDASYEPTSPYPGGIGGVLVLPGGQVSRHFSEVFDPKSSGHSQ